MADPPLSEKVARDDDLSTSQRNIEYLKENTSIHHSRAERTVYMSAIVNTGFMCSTSTAQAIFEFITGDRMSTTCVTQVASAIVARYALNRPDSDIIIDMRKLNARPKGNEFDPFWAKMAEIVEGRVNDRRHGDTLYMPVATSIPILIKLTVDALDRVHAPKTLEALGIDVPTLTWVTLQFCAKNPLCSSALNYTGALKLTHKVQQGKP